MYVNEELIDLNTSKVLDIVGFRNTVCGSTEKAINR